MTQVVHIILSSTHTHTHTHTHKHTHVPWLLCAVCPSWYWPTLGDSVFTHNSLSLSLTHTHTHKTSHLLWVICIQMVDVPLPLCAICPSWYWWPPGDTGCTHNSLSLSLSLSHTHTHTHTISHHFWVISTTLYTDGRRTLAPLCSLSFMILMNSWWLRLPSPSESKIWKTVLTMCGPSVWPVHTLTARWKSSVGKSRLSASL